jgi:hypothetical protein
LGSNCSISTVPAIARLISRMPFSLASGCTCSAP